MYIKHYDDRYISLSNWLKNKEHHLEDVPCAPRITVSLKGHGVKSSGWTQLEQWMNMGMKFTGNNLSGIAICYQFYIWQLCKIQCIFFVAVFFSCTESCLQHSPVDWFAYQIWRGKSFPEIMLDRIAWRRNVVCVYPRPLPIWKLLVRTMCVKRNRKSLKKHITDKHWLNVQITNGGLVNPDKADPWSAKLR